MAFFGLAAADSMGDCCYEEFKDRKKDSSDLSLEQAFMGDDEPKPLPANASLRQKMRHSFEYPHSNTSGGWRGGGRRGGVFEKGRKHKAICMSLDVF